MPHPSGFEGCGLSIHEIPAETHLWNGPSALHHVQLLPAAAATGNGARARHLLEDSRRSSRKVRPGIDRLHPDAGAHSPTDERAECGEPLDRDAGAEAAGFASDETKAGSKKSGSGPTSIVGGSREREGETFLAVEVLRFQRVELEKEEREVELHAFQSGEAGIGETSEGLEMEQLRILFTREAERMSAESAVGSETKAAQSRKFPRAPFTGIVKGCGTLSKWSRDLGELRCDPFSFLGRSGRPAGRGGWSAG